MPLATTGCLGLAGCTPNDQDQQPNSTTEDSSPKVSAVPLRIWIVGTVRQPETIARQWNANSEQPVDIRSLSVEELLDHEKCAADLLFYPSRLIGELHQRQWIVPLPSRLSKLVRPESDKPQQDKAVDDEEIPPPPPALVAASSYSGTNYGLPLGYSMVSLIGSNSVKSSSLTWQQLQENLKTVEKRALEFDDARIDRNALVDRFLRIAFGNTTSNSKYGVLFDVHTLKARLNSSEFLFAAELLQALACQIDAVDSVIGSHSAAWQWVSRAQQPCFALVSPSHLDADTSQLDSATYIPIDADRNNNDGSGVVASVTNQCQQTSQATHFLQWIYKPRTMEALRGQVEGMTGSSARGRTLAERVLAASGTMLQDDNLITEPRMPGAEKYRSVMADQLLGFLREQRSCEDFLAATNEAWDNVTKQKGGITKTDYERSLGLRT